MKSGFIAIVGKPNVGKSTLLNALMGQKVSVVSPRPATTRLKILGIMNRPEGQAIFSDTPGFEKVRNELGSSMLKTVHASVADADFILLIVAAPGVRDEDAALINVLEKTGKKIICGINKVDLLERKETLLPLIERLKKTYGFADIIPFSALKNENLDELEKVLFEHLPEGDPLFPPDSVTNIDDSYRTAEIIREKILQLTYEEVPQGVAVEIEEMGEGRKNKEMLAIKAIIVVERESLKPILIGKNGEKLKQIGKRARQELEIIFKRKVYLELWVKVIKDWRDRPDVFRRFGYGNF